MKTTLGNIANIQTGIFAKPIDEGEIVYLQAKHFDENGNLISLLHPDLNSNDIPNKHFLQQGDVLFAAKGTKNFAACYQNINQPSVASTSFFVIRLLDNINSKILPEFLVWFLNNPSSQKYLKSNAIGTAIVSISKNVLAELEILIPNLQTQKSILKISQLRKSELDLKQQIEILKERQIQQYITNALNR